MTQIQTNLTLAGSDTSKPFQLPDVYTTELYFSRNTTSELLTTSSPTHNPISIPPFVDNNSLASQLDTINLGNPVRKKVRHNPDSPSSPTITLPSMKHTFSMINLWPNFVDPPLLLPEQDANTMQDIMPLNDEPKKLPQKRTLRSGKLYLKNGRDMGTVIDENETEEKPIIEKPKVKSLKEKELLMAKNKSVTQEHVSNQEFDANSAVETLSSSTYSNSPNLRVQEEYQLPQVISQDLADQTSKQLQQALQALQNKICVTVQQGNEVNNIKKQQNHLLIETKDPVYAILDNISRASESENLNEQQILSLFMDDPKAKELAAFIALNNTLEALAPQANITFPALDLKGIMKIKQEADESKKDGSIEKFSLKMLEEIEVVRSECGDKEVMTVEAETEGKLDDSIKTKDNTKINEPVKKEVSRIEEEEKEQEETKVVNKREKKSKSNKPSKVGNKTFSKENNTIKRKMTMTKVTAKTKKGVIFVSPWSMESTRRRNKWQLNEHIEHNAVKSPSAEVKKEVVQSPRITVGSIHMEGVEIKETPVGKNHQVPIPTMLSKRAKNDRKRFPKLKWSPTTLTKLRLEYYFKTLGEMIQCEDISHERAIKLLKDHNNDPRKVYKTIEGREKEFLREFIVRPRRKP